MTTEELIIRVEQIGRDLWAVDGRSDDAIVVNDAAEGTEMTSSWIIELPHMGEIKVYHRITPLEAAQHVTEQTHNIMSRPKQERDEALRRNRRLTHGSVMLVGGSLDQGDEQ